MPIKVTAEDTENGETGVKTLEGDDYCLVTSGRMHIAAISEYSNGTVQLTLKIRKDDES